MPAAVIIGAAVATGVAESIGAAVIGSVIEGAVVSSVAATAVGAGIVSGGLTAVQGGSASDVLRSAVMTGATSFIGGTIGQALSTGSSGVSNLTDAQFAAADAAQLARQGLSQQTIINNLVGAGVDPTVASSLANQALRGATADAMAATLGQTNVFTPSYADTVKLQYTTGAIDTNTAMADLIMNQDLAPTTAAKMLGISDGATYWNPVTDLANAQAGQFIELANGDTMQMPPNWTAQGNGTFVDTAGNIYDVNGKFAGTTTAGANTTFTPPRDWVSLADGSGYVGPGGQLYDLGGSAITDVATIVDKIGVNPQLAAAEASGSLVDIKPGAGIDPHVAKLDTATGIAYNSNNVAVGQYNVNDLATRQMLGLDNATGLQNAYLMRGNEVLWNGQVNAATGQYYDVYGNPVNNPYQPDIGARMVGETGQVLQGAAPPSAVTPTFDTSKMIAVKDAAGNTGYYNPLTGEVLNAQGQVATNIQTMPTVAQGPGVQVASSEPFRVEVSGTPAFAGNPQGVTAQDLPAGTRLATESEMMNLSNQGFRATTLDNGQTAWIVNEAPAQLTPITPVELPVTQPIPEVVVQPSISSAVQPVSVGQTAGSIAGGMASGTGGAVSPTPTTTTYTPLTVSGPVTPAEAAVGGVSASAPVTPAPVPTMPEVVITAPSVPTATTAGQTVGAVAPSVITNTPVTPAVTAPVTGQTTPTTTAPTTITTTTPTQTGPAPGVNPNGSPAVTTTANPDGTSTTTYADGTKVTTTDYTNIGSTVGAVVGSGALTPSVPTIPTVTAGPYSFGTAQPVVNPGVNPGYLMGGVVRPQIMGATPTQTQFYWGGRPLITDINQLNTYNTAIPTTQPYGVAYAAGTGTNQLNLQDTINAVLGRGQALSAYPSATTPVAPIK